jgi:flagellar motility protein MotE (MotC chaperone)
MSRRGEHLHGPGGLAVALAGRGRRPSPLLITAALALLLAALRLAELAGRIEWPGATAPAAVAEAEPAAADAPDGEVAAATGLLEALLPVPAVEPAAGPEGGAGPGPANLTGPSAPGSGRVAPTSADPLADVAAELARRAAELDRREQELVLREATVVAVETRLGEQLGRLEALKKELEATASKIREKDEAELAQLVKTYEAMKAKNAAQVFDQLALEVLLPIVRRMREAKLAAVLAAMEPGKAKQVTAALAQNTPLPRLP